MRHTTLLCCVLASVSVTALAQEGAPSGKPVQKGDSIVVKGCLTGTALEATEASGLEAAAADGGLTFRLTGDKKLLKSLREEHDRKIVEVRGILKSDPPLSGAGTRIGKMRITIGAASPATGRPEAESRRSVPVLEVRSFDGGQTSCAR